MRAIAASNVRFLTLEAIQFGRLPSGELFGALSCFAPCLLERLALRPFELPQRTFDLLPRIEQVAARLLTRLALCAALALANVALTTREVRHALSRILEHRRRLLLARGERLGSLLELLDQCRDVSLLPGETLLGA